MAGKRSVSPAGRTPPLRCSSGGSITKGLVGTTAWLTLEVERPVVHYLPGVPDAEMTVADLVHHTSGLPRLPAAIRDSLFRDPYRKAVGVPLELAAAVPVAPRGRFVYSNLGYALLGAVLDAVHGDWFAAVRQQVLEPAGGQHGGARACSVRARGAEALRSSDQAVGARGIVVRGCWGASGPRSTISVAMPTGRSSLVLGPLVR
ncbi:serine hydrolase [Curtobacterium sp. MCPF17_052]|uniref:serine hydrolase n=1 Tax=Curtobacterium sp. MCPF17_052 TaxID=2175655 RepID=UPI003464758E